MFGLIRFVIGGAAKALLLTWLVLFALHHGEQIPKAASAFAESVAASIPEDTGAAMRDTTSRTYSLLTRGVSRLCEGCFAGENPKQK